MSKSAKGSERPRMRGKVLRLSWTSLLLAAFPVVAVPLPQESERPVIENIFIQADGQAGEQNLEELISVRKGEPYSLKKIDQSVKQIHQTGLFSDIRVLRSGDTRVDLTFVLTHNLTIRSLSFFWREELPQAKMMKAVEALRPGSFFSEDKIDQAVGELKEFLKSQGYFEPEVRAETMKDVNASVADVVFKIGSWKRFRIGKIAFSGSPIVSENELSKRLRNREGAIYVPSKFREDLERLKDFYNALGYQTAVVDIVREDFDQAGGRVTLEIKVLPREKISFLIRGARVPASLLAPIWEERIFEEWGLAEGEARILTFLRKQGYVFASADSRIERPENEIRVIYDISPGEKYRIDSVEFEGLSSFPPSRIRAEVGINEKLPFFALLNGERLFEIPREIELFYQTHGFPDCHVDLNLKSRGRAATAIFSIQEGPQDRITRLAVEGISMFPPDAVRAAMVSSEGGPFFAPNVQNDVERIESFYLDRGVRGTKAVSEVELISANSFSVTISVTEGRRIRIGGVIITGNKVTRKGTISREVRLKEGDDASRELILDTKRRIENLGVFSEVRIDEVPVSEESENLVITVREGERNYASLGVGLETRNEPRTFALWENDIRLRGTAEFIRSNIFGTASQISLVSQFSLIEKRGVVSWVQPYFFGMPMQTSMNAWLEREDRTSFGFDRRGISLNTVKPLGGGFHFLGTISLSRTKLTYLEIAESEVDRQLRPYSTSLVSGSVIWDRRDDTFNPTRGFFLSFVGEWAFPVFKIESDYIKSFIKFQHYNPILTHLNFSTTVRLGLGRGRMPVPERFFAGGSNSFRGERFDELGPKDPETGMPVGGKAMFLVNLEMKFPLSPVLKDLSGAVFYDLGQVFSKRKDFGLFSLRGALGWGLRYRTPLGPLRFDMGWAIDSPKEKGRPLLFITIGNMF